MQEDTRGNLRRRAEEILESRKQDHDGFSDDRDAVIHELLVNQIELEMQNDELRRIQIDLDTAQQRYRQLYEFSPVALVRLTDGLLVEDCNIMTSEMLRCDKAGLERKPLSRWVHEEDQDAYFLLMRKVLASKTPSMQEVRFRIGSDILWCVMRVGLLESGNNRKQYLEVAILDVTDTHRAEESLRITEENLGATWFGYLGRWDWEYASGRVVSNRLKTEVLGYGPGEIAPHVDAFTSLIHPDDFDRTMANMRDHLMGKTSVYEVEYRIRCKDGGWKWFYDRGLVVERDAVGKPRRIAGIVFDIDEKRRQMEELERVAAELRRSNEDKDRLLSIIAHDMRSPVTAAIELVEMLVGGELGPDDAAEVERILLASLRRQSALLESLLEWAKVQTGRIRFQRESLNLEEIFSKARAAVEQEAYSKKLTIAIEIGENAAGEGDAGMLETVLRNLLTNAVKFTPDGGRIALGARNTTEGLEIAVRDNGVGMTQEVRDSVFSFANRQHTRGTRGEAGSGLGLALCHDFVQIAGGRIRVESTSGAGSSFIVILP
mgnify:FL=1